MTTQLALGLVDDRTPSADARSPFTAAEWNGACRALRNEAERLGQLPTQSEQRRIVGEVVRKIREEASS